MKAPKWWDAGRSPYRPNNPFLNTNMIWIAGITPSVVCGVSVLIWKGIEWLSAMI